MPGHGHKLVRFIKQSNPIPGVLFIEECIALDIQAHEHS